MTGWFNAWGDWRRKRFWILALLIAWTLLGFFGAPPLIERMLKQAIEETGRSIDIADVRTNPFALSLQIDGLEIRDPDQTPIFSFDELYTNFQLSSLINWAWTFREIRLSALHVEEERFSFDESRLLRFSNDLSEGAEAIASDPDDAPPRIVIHNLVLENGSIGLTDQTAGGFHGEFGPVSVTANDLRTLPDHAGEKQVSIVTPAGGVISWRGDLQFVPLASKGHLTVSGKGLPAALRYADHFLPFSLEGDEVDIAFDYAVETPGGALSIAVDNWNARTSGIKAIMDDRDEAFLSLAHIELKNGSWRWPEQTAHAESLALDGLELIATLDEQGHLSLLDANPASKDPVVGNDAPNQGGWEFSLDRLELNGGTIDFEDQSVAVGAPVLVEDLNIALTDFDNKVGTKIPAEVAFRLASGGSVTYSGSVTAIPSFEVDGQATLSDFELTLVQPWLAQHARLELLGGKANMEAQISGGPSSFLSFRGDAGVTGLELHDSLRNQRLAALESLQLERFEFLTEGMTLKTSPLMLRGAYGRIHIFEDLSTNLQGLGIGDEDAVKDNDNDESANSVEITVAGVEVEDAALDFADDSLPLPFSTAIRGLDGSLSTLSMSSAEPAKLELAGQVNEFGEARIQGSLNPWDFTESSDVRMTFRNLQMATLTPYTVQYAGYAVEGGRLDLDLGYTLQQRQLDGDNKIVIRELVLGDKVEHPDAVSLPLKLAVALLKDSDGVIDVDLPVSGNLDDPQFKLSGIVWKAIFNLITRVVTSPFRFLGSLVGVDSEDFGTLSFQAGSSEVSPPDQEQLLKLAEAMSARPELSVVVTGVYAEDADRPALRELAFKEQFETRRAALLESGEVEVISADRPTIESLFEERFPERPLEPFQAEFTQQEGENAQTATGLDEPAYLQALRNQLVAAEVVGEDALNGLAAARAAAVVQVFPAGSGEAPLAISASEEVESVESKDGVIVLELEVSVGENAVQTTEG